MAKSHLTKAKNKFVGVDGEAVFSKEETAFLYQLSRQQTQLLLQILPSMHWPTRWDRQYPQNIIDEFVSNLELALMTPIDVNQPTGGYSLATLPIGAIFDSLSPLTPTNCLPLWQDYNNDDVPQHPDFQKIDGNSNYQIMVLEEDYPDLYTALPDCQDSYLIGGTYKNVVQLSGFMARTRITVNPTANSGLSQRLASDVTGAETHQLTTNEMPSHSHNLNATGSARYANTSPSGLADIGRGATGADGSNPTTSVGGNEAHNNMQPSYVVYTYIVAKPANDLFDGVVTDDNICEYVEQCIDNGGGDNPQMGGYDPNENPIIETLDCVWGGLERLMLWLNSELNNYMDILDELGDIAASVPGFTLIGSIVEFAGVFSAALTSVVRIGNNEDLRIEIMCFLFCRIKDRGAPYQLLPEDIEAYKSYAWQQTMQSYCPDIIPYELCPAALIELLELPHDAALMAFYYMFSMYPYRSYLLRFALGYSDECNDDWQTLCDCVGYRELQIDANDAANTSADIVFSEGTTYRVIASGFYKRANSNQTLNDAAYSTDDGWNTVKPYVSSNGLYMNNVKLPELPYSPTHVYIWDIAGYGGTPSFKIMDTAYSDNSGSLSLTIIEL